MSSSRHHLSPESSQKDLKRRTSRIEPTSRGSLMASPERSSSRQRHSSSTTTERTTGQIRPLPRACADFDRRLQSVPWHTESGTEFREAQRWVPCFSYSTMTRPAVQRRDAAWAYHFADSSQGPCACTTGTAHCKEVRPEGTVIIRMHTAEGTQEKEPLRIGETAATHLRETDYASVGKRLRICRKSGCMSIGRAAAHRREERLHIDGESGCAPTGRSAEVFRSHAPTTWHGGGPPCGEERRTSQRAHPGRRRREEYWGNPSWSFRESGSKGPRMRDRTHGGCHFSLGGPAVVSGCHFEVAKRLRELARELRVTLPSTVGAEISSLMVARKVQAFDEYQQRTRKEAAAWRTEDMMASLGGRGTHARGSLRREPWQGQFHPPWEPMPRDWIRTGAAEQRGVTPFKPWAPSSSIISSYPSEFRRCKTLLRWG
ncbi:unnamed protein product [Lampetra planeri]